jgi:hypothetical protein
MIYFLVPKEDITDEDERAGVNLWSRFSSGTLGAFGSSLINVTWSVGSVLGKLYKVVCSQKVQLPFEGILVFDDKGVTHFHDVFSGGGLHLPFTKANLKKLCAILKWTTSEEYFLIHPIKLLRDSFFTKEMLVSLFQLMEQESTEPPAPSINNWTIGISIPKDYMDKLTPKPKKFAWQLVQGKVA